MQNNKILIEKIKNIIIELEGIAKELEKYPDVKKKSWIQKISDFISEKKDSSSNKATSIVQKNAAELYLNKNGIKITGVNTSTGDLKTETISRYIGTKFESVKELISRIKASQADGKSFKMNLSKSSQQTISDICQLANMLHKIAFIEEYTYKNSPFYELKAKTTMAPLVQNYFSGAWLEEYVRTCLDLVVEKFQDKISISSLHNPQIKFQNDDNFELDLFSIINGQPLWIESKTGDYQRHLMKYTNILKTLGIPRQNFILVLSGINQQETQELERIHKINIANCETILSKIDTVVSNILEQETSHYDRI